jgi:hypothetical protein
VGALGNVMTDVTAEGLTRAGELVGVAAPMLAVIATLGIAGIILARLISAAKG